MYKLLLEEIIGKMRKSVSQGEGGMYLDQVYYISSDEGNITLGTSSKFFKDRLETLGFIKKIEDELSDEVCDECGKRYDTGFVYNSY